MLRFDLHVHSEYSRDCRSPVEEILRSARRQGLNGIAVCDHDDSEGGRAALELAEKKEEFRDLTVIPGVEISTSEGHLLVLNPPCSIPPGLTPEETIRRIREADVLRRAFIIIPHPYRKSAHGIGRIEGLDVDGVETFNSKNIFGNSNRKAENEAERLDLPKTGGSDAHTPDLVGRCYTTIPLPASENNAEDVLKALREGRSGTGGKTTPFSAVIGQMMKNVIRRLRKAAKGDYREW